MSLFSRRKALQAVGGLVAWLVLPHDGSERRATRPTTERSCALELGGARQTSILASGYTGAALPSDLIGLIRSSSPAMRFPTSYGAASHNACGFNKWTVDDLAPGRTYYWQLTRNGSPYGPIVRARTLRAVGVPCTIRIAGGGCQRSSPSSAAAFADAVAWGYDRFVHFGDDGYPNDLDTTLDTHERAYARAMTDPARLLIQVAGAVDKIVSDHDCNQTSTSPKEGNSPNYHDPVTAASLRAWADVVPVPMHDPRRRGRYWSCVEGNVRFVYTDTRSLDRTDVLAAPIAPDDPTSTMLGKHQLSWLKSEIHTAATAGQFVQIFTDPGWNGTAEVNPETGVIVRSNSDKWCAYTYERDQISDFIKTSYAAHGKGVNAAVAHSDTHAIQQDATHERNGMLAWCCGPLDQGVHALPTFCESYDYTFPGWAKDGIAVRHVQKKMYQQMTWAEDSEHRLTLTVTARNCTPKDRGTPRSLRTLTKVYML
jgi:phosphodiesterase/alkaline phosphatase D-like protein